MKRKEFLRYLGLAPAILGTMKIKALEDLAADLTTGQRMPALFIGHGSPMNGIEDNEFSRTWARLGAEIPRPAAVLVVSAHWLTKGTAVTAMASPRTIHDFGGFPKALFEVQYPAPGSPAMAAATQQAITTVKVDADHEWGLDHGTWTVVRHMYPGADIPVLQLSIDYNRPPQYHYELARQLNTLRKKGVLIIGSGNMVHNLGKVAWDKLGEPEYGFDWALEMNATFKRLISSQEHAALIDYQKLGSAARLAIPTPDHYYPLLYVLGLQERTESATFFNDKAVGGSLTMTGVKIS